MPFAISWATIPATAVDPQHQPRSLARRHMVDIQVARVDQRVHLLGPAGRHEGAEQHLGQCAQRVSTVGVDIHRELPPQLDLGQLEHPRRPADDVGDGPLLLGEDGLDQGRLEVLRLLLRDLAVRQDLGGQQLRRIQPPPHPVPASPALAGEGAEAAPAGAVELQGRPLRFLEYVGREEVLLGGRSDPPVAELRHIADLLGAPAGRPVDHFEVERGVDQLLSVRGAEGSSHRHRRGMDELRDDGWRVSFLEEALRRLVPAVDIISLDAYRLVEVLAQRLKDPLRRSERGEGGTLCR